MYEEHRERALDRLAALEARQGILDTIDGARDLLARADRETDPRKQAGAVILAIGGALDALEEIARRLD